MRAIEIVPGVEVDVEHRRLWLAGQEMAVGHLLRSPYSPGSPHRRDGLDPHTVDILTRFVPRYDLDKPRQAMPESIHCTLLCGENGWWVELSIYPGGHGFWQGLNVEEADAEIHEPFDVTAGEAFGIWRRNCVRRDPPPRWQDEEWAPGPFAGLEPGTWLWTDDPEECAS
jgi:hypothetical protein